MTKTIAEPANMTTAKSRNFRSMFSLSPADALWWATEARNFAAVIAAVAAIIAVVASYAQTRYNSQVSKDKDLKFEVYKTDASKRIAEAELAAAESNERSIKLNVDLERERIKLAELRIKIGPRQLESEQASAITQTLTEATTRLKIDVYAKRTQEAVNYGNQIATALKQGGADVSGYVNDDLVLGVANEGLYLVFRTPEAKEILTRAFTRAGLLGSIRTKDAMEKPEEGGFQFPTSGRPDNHASLTVFTKPSYVQ